MTTEEENGKANIIDTKKFIEKLDTEERMEKIKTTKKLNRIAEAEVEGELKNKTNPFMNLKIPRNIMRKTKRKKKPVIDLEKFLVKDYYYEEFSKSVNNVLPNVINYVSFNDTEFLNKLKKSKDIKHFSDTQILFPITNDYMGFAGAVIGCGLEHYADKLMNIKKEIKNKKPENIPLPNDEFEIQSCIPENPIPQLKEVVI